MAGAKESGATTFLLSHDIDTGDVLGRVRLDIGADENAGSLHDRILEAGKHLLAETVDNLAEGVAEVKPQSEYDLEASELLEAPKLFKADRKIDWNRSSKEVHNLIRGLSPSPGAVTYLPESENDPIKILSATPSEKTGLAPGEIHISDNRFTVGTQNGSLDVKRIQPPGKGAMDIGDFLRGTRISLENFVS
jgi:methionyl-tRNA formyltransferase